MPNLALGAEGAGRRLDDLEVIVPAFLVVGDTSEEQERWREMARMQVAFYGSTPNYGFIFDQLGFEGTTARIRQYQKRGDLAGMAAVITDEILEHFIISGTWDGIADAIRARYLGTATRVVSYFGSMAIDEGPESWDRWAAVARRVTQPAG